LTAISAYDLDTIDEPVTPTSLLFMPSADVHVFLADPKASVPTTGSSEAAGYDLRAVGDYFLQPGETIIVDTGLVMRPHHGFRIDIRSRSGLAAKHNIFVLNSPGTIDRDYSGPNDVVKVILHMLADTPYSKLPHIKDAPGPEEWGFQISRGDRIAQMLLTPTYVPHFKEVDASFFLEDGQMMGNRDGLGSTGIK